MDNVVDQAGTGLIGDVDAKTCILLLKQGARLAHLGHYLWSGAQGRFLLVSNELLQIFGISLERFNACSSNISRSFEAWVHPDDRAGFRQATKTMVEKCDRMEIEYRIVRADGAIRHIDERSFFLDDERFPGLFVGTLQDITERVERRKRRMQAERQEAVGLLASGIAHELNNLMQPIVGGAQMTLRSLSDSDPNRHRQESVIAAGQRAKELISGVLTYAQRSVFAVDYARTDIADAVTAAIEECRPTLPDHIALEAAIEPDVPLVHGNPEHLRKVVEHLVGNAKDAIGKKAGTITVALRKTTLEPKGADDASGMAPGDYVLLQVTDTGCGFDPKGLQHAVDPFYTTKEVGSGTGLGLSIVHGIVAQHEGNVRIRNNDDGGATVEAFLPVA